MNAFRVYVKGTEIGFQSDVQGVCIDAAIQQSYKQCM